MVISLKKGLQFAFIDIGHGMLKLAKLNLATNELALFQRPSQGVCKGQIYQDEDFQNALKLLFHDAGIFDQGIQIVLNLPSIKSHIEHKTAIHWCHGQYSSDELRELMANVFGSSIGSGVECIDMHIAQATLDGHAIELHNFGVLGREFVGEALLASESQQLLEQVLKTFNSIGLEVGALTSNGLGLCRAADALVSHLKHGAVLDFGHSTTTGFLIVGGLPQKIFTVAAGSNHVNRDLALGLQVSLAQAETIKQTIGVLELPMNDEQVENLKIQQIIKPRVAEIFARASHHLSLFTKSGDLPIFITGNGSKMPGLSKFLTKHLWSDSPQLIALTRATTESMLQLTVKEGSTLIDSSWLCLIGQINYFLRFRKAINAENANRPLSRLRPLWSWLSELSQ